MEIVSSTISNNVLSGVHLEDDSHVDVMACEISENNGDGIELSNSSALLLDECAVFENALSGIFAEDQSQLELSNCKIYGNVHGIELAGSVQVVASKTSIFDNRYSGVDLSDSTSADITNGHLFQNTVGIRVRGSSQVELAQCHLSENAVGAILLGSTQAHLTECAISENGWDGIVLWDDAEALFEECSFTDNGRFDTAVGAMPIALSEEGPYTGRIAADGANLAFPEEPPEAVRKAAGSVIEIHCDGRDEVTGMWLPLAANGVVVAPNQIVTAAHLFYGEESWNPNILLEIEKLVLWDRTNAEILLEFDDFTEGGGPELALNNDSDIASLFTDSELPHPLPIAQGVPPYDIVWIVGCIDWDWYFIPGFVSFPERSFWTVWREVLLHLERPFTLPDVFVELSELTPEGGGLSGSPIVTTNGEVIAVVTKGFGKGFGPVSTAGPFVTRAPMPEKIEDD